MRLLFLLFLLPTHIILGQVENINRYNQQLTDSILTMGELDQSAAGLPIKGMNWDQFTIYKDSVFNLNYFRIKKIFNNHGYPGYAEIGESAETSFWGIVQHCDFAPEFQQEVLDSMLIEVRNNNANPRHYGLLFDRVQLNTGNKQLYGTQVRYNHNTGQAYPKPLSDSTNVNHRRKEFGFESLEEYLNLMTVRHYNMNEETMNTRAIKEPMLYPENEISVRKIAITIDDVPNTRSFRSNNYHSILLNQLDSLNIPVTIFINIGLIYKTDSISKNLDLLDNWAERDYTTLANHTYSHMRYSEVGYDKFKTDIEEGENQLKDLANKNKKELKYFRFPYNDLGIDSLQHCKIDSTLQAKSYISTPFTVESSDWMFNYIYEYYLSISNFEKAEEIGQLYVSKTLDFIHFFDSLSYEKYGRNINHIYLCHDNPLNANYLDNIIDELEKKAYSFISLDEAMMDPVYHQDFKYYRKWGVSWLYRYMPTQKERVSWMKLEPDISRIELLYEKLANRE